MKNTVFIFAAILLIAACLGFALHQKQTQISATKQIVEHLKKTHVSVTKQVAEHENETTSKESEENFPPALAKHLDELSKAIPENGGEGNRGSG